MQAAPRSGIGRKDRRDLTVMSWAPHCGKRQPMDRDRQFATLRYWMDVEGLIAPDAGKEESERYQACASAENTLGWGSTLTI